MSRRRHVSPLYDDPRYGADLRAGYYHAHRLGLCPADCEDCAMEFLLSRLLRSGENDPVDSAWRHRCASNFAKNVVRSHTNRSRREVTSDISDETLTAVPSPLPNPEEEVLRRAFWEEIHSCAESLRPIPRQMFLRYYEQGESILELAAAFRENPHGVEQKLHRARRRLQELLAQRGLDAITLQRYLTSEKSGKSVSLPPRIVLSPAEETRDCVLA